MKLRWLPALAALCALCACAPTHEADTHAEHEAKPAPTDMDPEQVLSPTELAGRADVPLYPEADVPDGKSNFKRAGAETRYELIMTTPDAPEKVKKFYAGHLAQAQNMGETLMGSSPKGNSVMVTAKQDLGLTTITVVSIAMAMPTKHK